MSGQHAPLPPSSAPLWGHCSGWRLACAGLPDLETDDTRRGDAAHAIAPDAILGRIDLPSAVGTTAPNGMVTDQEIVDGVEVYVQDVREASATLPAHHLWIGLEHRVRMPAIHEHNWGTLDCAVWSPQAKKLILWDYKHGHRRVYARGNLQGADYLQGLCKELDAPADTDIEFRAVQPNCFTGTGPIDVWKTTVAELWPIWDQLRRQADASYNNPTLTTGLHCRDCLARNNCDARRRVDYNLIDLANEPYQMDVMGAPDMARERQILKDGLEVIRRRVETLDDELAARIKQGETGTGLVVSTTNGRERWTIPPEQVIALTRLFDVDSAKPGTLTPAQVRRRADKAIRPHLAATLATVTERPTGALQLMPAEDCPISRAFQPVDSV